MSLYATEAVVQPVIMDGIVSIDYANRTLTVRKADQVSGAQSLAFRTAYAALKQSEATGYRTGRTVWASGAGGMNVAWAAPGDNLSLRFTFPVSDSGVFERLSGRPGLAARVSVDRSRGVFIGVRFTNSGS